MDLGRTNRLRLSPHAAKPAAVEPEINAAGKLDVARRPPVLAYPNNRSERDRLALQSFCRTQARRLRDDLRHGKFGDNFPVALFADVLEYYLDDLPAGGREGSFLLADLQANELRDLAEDAAPILPNAFARRVAELLTKHDELRAYYVEIADSDRATPQAKLAPPPPEPLVALQKALEAASPEAVTPEFVGDTRQILRAIPSIELDPEDRRTGPDIIHPPRVAPGAPGARQQHAQNVLTLLARLDKIVGVANVKDGVALAGGLHNVFKLLTDLRPLIDAILKHWPF